MPEPSSVQEQLAYFKYPDTPAVDYLLATYGPKGSNLFTTIVNRNNPAVGDQNATGWWYESVIAHIVARGLLYISSVSGNACGGGVPRPASGTAAAGVGAVGSLGRVGIASVGMVSSIGGPASLGFAAAGSIAGDVLGFATLGLGLAIGPLMALIQHHGQAVQNEDNTICSVATSANQIIPQIDQAVATGSITAAQGIQAMASLVQQLNVQLNTVSGAGSSGHPCNAGCVYQAVLKTHLDFVTTSFYADISPMTQKQLPVAPGTYAPNSASAPIVQALAKTPIPSSQVTGAITPPGSGSPRMVQSLYEANSSNLNAAGSQNGTFSSVPNILTLGTGTAPPAVMGNSMWIILIGVVALGAFVLLHKG
jgi:hypothetical protein